MNMDTHICGELGANKLRADADDIACRLSCGLELLYLVRASMVNDERKASEYGDAVYGVYDYMRLLNEELESAVEAEYRNAGVSTTAAATNCACECGR